MLLNAQLSAAYNWRDLQIGGFVSQGYLVNTGHNDYLGETSEGTFDFREYAVNASYARGSIRVGAQAFGQKLGTYGDDKILLDWATIDWQPKQWFGVRAGRVKTPRGLYNEALDVDAIRPYILLPQSVYESRLRDFNASFDGAMMFGNVSLGRFGSFDYKLFHGKVSMDLQSGSNDYFNNDVPFSVLSLGMDSALGSTLFWNTPVNGLRVGYSYSKFAEFGSLFAIPQFDISFSRTTDAYDRHLASIEYFWRDWTFAAEAGSETALYKINSPVKLPFTSVDVDLTIGYVSAARRFGENWEIGAYYSYSKETQVVFGSDDPEPALVQHDYAISAKRVINANWSVKAELHYLDGAGKIFSTSANPQPLADRDTSWSMLAVKTTYSF